MKFTPDYTGCWHHGKSCEFALKSQYGSRDRCPASAITKGPWNAKRSNSDRWYCCIGWYSTGRPCMVSCAFLVIKVFCVSWTTRFFSRDNFVAVFDGIRPLLQKMYPDEFGTEKQLADYIETVKKETLAKLDPRLGLWYSICAQKPWAVSWRRKRYLEMLIDVYNLNIQTWYQTTSTATIMQICFVQLVIAAMA